MRNYTEQYLYDAVGNFQKLIHQAANGNWTRDYAYNESWRQVATRANGQLAVGRYTFDARQRRWVASVFDVLTLDGDHIAEVTGFVTAELLSRWGTEDDRFVGATAFPRFGLGSDSNDPALLTHDEVLTLFHEFGHGLHHLLTRVDEAAVSGIRGVAWDAVELPSQFMENWAYDRDTLNGFAHHWQTGAAIPDELLKKLQASRSFQSGLATVRQIEFALFDLRLHRDYTVGSGPENGARVLETLNQARSEVSVLTPPAWNRMPNSFSHVFAGGYAAGYYSYKWAEVLSSDAYAKFEEDGVLIY